MKFAVLIPAFNPDDLLLRIVEELWRKDPPAVVIVDDGSMPAAADLFKSLRDAGTVTVLSHAVNRGKGEAIKSGLSHIYSTYPRLTGTVVMDADGQHSVADCLRVGEALENNCEALIIGSRKFSGEVPFRSRFGNTMIRGLINRAAGLDLSDTQSGLRGIPHGMVPALLEIGSSRYEFELDMILSLAQRDVNIIEVPIQTIYLDGNRSSHFRPLSDSFRILVRLGSHFSGSALSAVRRLRDLIYSYMPLKPPNR